MKKDSDNFLETKLRILRKLAELMNEENLHPRVQLDITNDFAESLRQTIMVEMLDHLGILSTKQSAENLKESLEQFKERMKE